MNNIVILGAGFAGLSCALKLEKHLRKKCLQNSWSVVLLDKNSYHTYTPALYEAASAYVWTGAGKGEVQSFEEELGGSLCLPLATALRGKNITFIHQEVIGIDFLKKFVRTKSEGKVRFEYMVLALGSESIYFGIEGAEACCYGLKTFYDALRIRRRIEEIFKNFKGGEIRITVVGGGATGVETIAEIAQYVRHIASDFKIDCANVKILLLEARDKILTGFPDSQRRNVEDRLRKLGVETRTGAKIRAVEKNCVILEQGEKCSSNLTIWAAGVKGPAFWGEFPALEKDKMKRLLVNEFLQIKNSRSIFAIGDNASFTDAFGNRAPPTAFVAEQQAHIAALNILHSIQKNSLLKYKISIPGYVLSCGGKYAAVSMHGITFSGIPGWALKRFIDLKYFLSILPFLKACSLWLQEMRMFTKND